MGKPLTENQLVRGYLFNSDDKTNYGIGVDRLGNKEDGLKCRWESNHHQIAFSSVGKFKLETAHYYTDYHATVFYLGEQLVSKDGFKSKIEAQHGAEELFKEFVLNGVKLLEKYKL